MAGGAEVAHEDVLEAETGFQELELVGFFKVEEDFFGWGLVAGGHHVEPLEGVGFVAGAEFVEEFGGVGEFCGEVGGDFGADFVAATADGGADGGEHVFRIGFEFHLHLADGFDDDAGECAAPARVDSGDDAFFGIDDQDGRAVGGADAEEQAGAISGEGVAFALLVGSWRCDCVEDADYVGVDLVERDEGLHRRRRGRIGSGVCFHRRVRVCPIRRRRDSGLFRR